METSNTFNAAQSAAYDIINGLSDTFAEASLEAAHAVELIERASDKAVKAAIDCGNWETCAPVFERIESDIRENKDGAAFRWNAPEAKTEGRFTVPHTVSHLKSQLKRAFENGVPLTDEAGEPRSFGQIRSDNAKVSKAASAAKKAEAQAAAADAAGLDLREYGMAQVNELRQLVMASDGANLAQLISAIESVVRKFSDPEDSESDITEEETGSAVALAA